jgi:hypothetical protein
VNLKPPGHRTDSPSITTNQKRVARWHGRTKIPDTSLNLAFPDGTQ